MFPRAHIYWFNDGGRRCWSNKRERRTYRAAPRQRLLPEAEPLPLIPAPPLAPLPPPVLPPAPQINQRQAPMLFENRWDEASAQGDDGDWLMPVYSTFAPGTEPDVWPALTPAHEAEKINTAVLAQVLAALLLTAMLAAAFWFATRQVQQLIGVR